MADNGEDQNQQMQLDEEEQQQIDDCLHTK